MESTFFRFSTRTVDVDGPERAGAGAWAWWASGSSSNSSGKETSNALGRSGGILDALMLAFRRRRCRPLHGPIGSKPYVTDRTISLAAEAHGAHVATPRN